MPPLTDEFKRHLHELMMEAADKVRDENARHKNELVHRAIKTNNSAAVPIAHSNASVDAFRNLVTTTIESYLNALDTCGVVVDGIVEREVLTEIHRLTGTHHPLTLPPGVQSPNVTAVTQEHMRKLARTGNELQRYAPTDSASLK